MDDKEVLRLYLDEKLSAPEVARRLGCGNTTVYRVLDRNGVNAYQHRRARNWGSRVIGREDAIVDAYRSGRSMADIAAELGVNRVTVRNALLRRDEPLKKPGSYGRVFSDDERKKALRLREEGRTTEQIAATLGCSERTVRQLFYDAGVPKRVVKRNRRERHYNQQGYAVVRVDEDDPLRPMAHKTGYVLEHRIVMARHLGRILHRNESVHHVNGVRTDNRVENLQLRYGKHGTGERLVCGDCGSFNIVHSEL